jgi:hypothetical protein
MKEVAGVVFAMAEGTQEQVVATSEVVVLPCFQA